jgi:hypothetical protein
MLGRRSYRNFTSSGFPKSGNNATSPQFVTLLKATIQFRKFLNLRWMREGRNVSVIIAILNGILVISAKILSCFY